MERTGKSRDQSQDPMTPSKAEHAQLVDQTNTHKLSVKKLVDPSTHLDLVTYALSMSENPNPRPPPIIAAVVIVTVVHVTTGCTAFEIFRGTRVPAVKPKSVAKSIESCAAGLDSPPNAAGKMEAPITARAPEKAAQIPNRLMSDARNTGGGFVGEAEAGLLRPDDVAGTGDERVPTKAAVETRLTNHPPKTRKRSLIAFALEGAGERGRMTKVGTKNTGSHLFSGRKEQHRDRDRDRVDHVLAWCVDIF